MKETKFKWITTKGPVVQTDTPNKVRTFSSQILYDGENDTIYLVPWRTVTDNYTIPLGINKSKWDARASHLHDIGCMYHKVIKVNLPLKDIYKYILTIKDNNTIIKFCKKIPREYLEVIPVTFNECNRLLYIGMRASNIPISKCIEFRLAVNFNINWLRTGKEDINIDNIYDKDLLT